MKNAADAKTMANAGPPEHWAFCFKRGTTDGDVRVASRAIGDRGAFSADPGLVVRDVGEGGEGYARIKFRDLAFPALKAAYCALSPQVDAGIPRALVVFSADPQGRVTGLQAVEHRGGTIVPYEPAYQAFQRFFVLETRADGIWLVPTSAPGSLLKLAFDACGTARLIGQATPTVLNAAALGMRPVRVLATGGLPDLAGGPDAIRARLQETRSQLASDQRILSGLVASSTREPPFQMLRTPGLSMRKYSYKGGCGPVNNARDIDRVFAGGRLVQETSVVDASGTAQREDRVAVSVEGLIALPLPGTYKYRFMINSHDAGEVYVNGRLAATHYGYHGADGRGVSIGTFDLPKGLVPFRARFVECTGTGGMIVSWSAYEPKARSWTPWLQIPRTAFYYDRKVTPQKRSEMPALQARIASTQARIAAMQGALGRLGPGVRDGVVASARDARGALSFGTSYRSGDGRFFVALHGGPDLV